MYVAVYPESPSQGLTAAILGAGFQPVPVADVADAGRKEPPSGWHAAVIELGDLPDLAMTIATKLREELSVSTVVVVDRTSTIELLDRDGFDDFLLTPIDQAELRVRLHRLGSSLETVAEEEIILRYHDLELNTATYQATIAGTPKDLTYMEYELLRFLVENPNRVWSREQILSKVWGYDYFGGSRTVDVHVRRLRAKLGEERASWITTVRSVGYRFG
ncbi:MAG: response regulator transcription factor [Acidimicrobiia bacterium]|nr:response regulator transcription factor [Acidimicrobiia bacterium]